MAVESGLEVCGLRNSSISDADPPRAVLSSVMIALKFADDKIIRCITEKIHTRRTLTHYVDAAKFTLKPCLHVQYNDTARVDISVVRSG